MYIDDDDDDDVDDDDADDNGDDDEEIYYNSQNIANPICGTHSYIVLEVHL